MNQPKKPQDHLPKTETPKVETVDGGRAVTLRGIRVIVPDEAIDDFELLEDMARMGQEKARQGLFPSVLRRLIGDDGFKDVMTGLRGDNGRVAIADGMGFIKDLLAALNPNS